MVILKRKINAICALSFVCQISAIGKLAHVITGKRKHEISARPEPPKRQNKGKERQNVKDESLLSIKKMVRLHHRWYHFGASN